MIQLQIAVQYDEEKKCMGIHLDVLEREDANDYERTWAHELEVLQTAIFKQIAKEIAEDNNWQFTEIQKKAKTP